MEIASFNNVPLRDLEFFLMEKWNLQMQKLKGFGKFVNEHKKYLEVAFTLVKQLSLHPSVKYSSVYLMFKYLKLCEEEVVEDKLFLMLTCLRIECKRYQTFSIDGDSIVHFIKAIAPTKIISKKDLKKYEMQVLNGLNFEINVTVIYDFIEVYLACFWTLISKRLDIEGMRFVSIIEMVCDYFAYDGDLIDSEKNPKLLACAIIYCASLIINKKASNALQYWLGNICDMSNV
ncbi:hypothetical protein ABK040_001734 [Willaertia magna]